MVRLAKYTENNFIDSAIDIAAQCGVASVSMSAIAVKVGAPIGSVYHRFDSRSAILARAWLKVKSDFRREVAQFWEQGNTWPAVLALLNWCRNKPAYARFLLQFEDFPDFGGALPAELKAQLEAEQAELDVCFERCAGIFECDTEITRHHLRFALIDAPIAIVKPYLSQNQEIPVNVETILRASHDAVCALNMTSIN
ncbi:TetR/AcrR family transcriptional regulator [Undibacterium sp. TS12]|uniref:TetR/AcrR family transcriptional regulator n=1 Tax=Undibacterium sp. TS12 TaxID=2908202 RepID=UPI001F4D0172|nr:TetR/AcrR family transcriptional regulator [Undibacterium sp. TS12]MCH8618520.1 TetR/AcrR family transcriptional regulator [Undibacterium sp. TS12]